MPPTGTPAADLSEEKMFPETVAGWGAGGAGSRMIGSVRDSPG